jgi:hypothetical protein
LIGYLADAEPDLEYRFLVLNNRIAVPRIDRAAYQGELQCLGHDVGGESYAILMRAYDEEMRRLEDKIEGLIRNIRERGCRRGRFMKDWI